MLNNSPHKTVNYVPDCPEGTVEEVLDILESWRNRSEDHFSNRRKSQRVPYPTQAVLVCTHNLGGRPGARRAQIVLPVQTRNLSPGGVGLLVAPMYVPERASEPAPRLGTDWLLAVGREISLGFPNPSNQLLWWRGVIVRSRVVHFGFREIGVSFISRGDADLEGSDAAAGGTPT